MLGGLTTACGMQDLSAALDLFDDGSFNDESTGVVVAGALSQCSTATNIRTVAKTDA